MSVKEIRSEVLCNLFEEHGVNLTPEQCAQVESIADGFADHIEMEHEQESYQFIGPSSCSDCKSKQRTIDRLEGEVDACRRDIVRRANMPESSSVEIFANGYIEITGPMR